MFGLSNEKIAFCRNKLQLWRRGDTYRANWLSEHASLLYTQFSQRGGLTDLEEALRLEREALELRLPGHPHRATSLSSIAAYLSSRFDRLGVLSDLEEAISLERSALELRLPGHPDRATSLSSVALYLSTRFSQLGEPSDLEEAWALCRSASELRSPRHPGLATSLSNVALSISERASLLYSQFSQRGTLTDLEQALRLERGALELRPPGHPNRATSLHNVAFYLSSRFDQLGVLSDLEEAISLGRGALEHRTAGHPDRIVSLSNIANDLSTRFKQLGVLSDLEEAIALGHNALELNLPGHPIRAASLGNIASDLFTRFNRLGALSDLEEAISRGRSALELCPPGDPNRATFTSNISAHLSARFEQLGELSDLEEAISLGRSALELRPPGHPERATSLSNVAHCLATSFNRLGALSDLEEAVSLARRALALCLPGHPNRATLLSNVARYLSSRFKQLGVLSDLQEAIALGRNVLELRPNNHPLRAASLGNIAVDFSTRFDQLGVLVDLEQAISLGRSALELRHEGHPDRAFSLSNVANDLCTRFKRLGELSDLEEAIVLERSALELWSPAHPRRAVSLNRMACYLSTRFDRLASLPDLEEALVFGRSALALHPLGHPERSLSLGNLARCFYAHFKHAAFHDITNLEKTFKLYSQLSDISQTAFQYDLQCASQWVEAAEKHEHESTVLAYQVFMRLSDRYLATLPALPQHLALLKQLTKSMAVNAFSACVRYGNPTNAIELLEQGRGVFWSQMMRLRSPLEEVIASGNAGKVSVDKFTRIASLLRSVLDCPSDAQSQHDRAFHLNMQLQDTVAGIRKLPGLSHFLQPLLFSDLQLAAAAGPVIIVNASQYGCDALILLSNRDPIHVPLRTTSAHVAKLSSDVRKLTLRAKLMTVEKEFIVLLRDLWDDVVFPIVQVLQQSCPHGSRVWWCPTAKFSLLPLHAAGLYKKGQFNFSDHYISSYTPTLTALLRARQKRSTDLSMEQHRFLVVGWAQAPGHDELPSVDKELSNISELVGPVTTVTRIQDEDANIAKVGEELKKTHFAHFACHGIRNVERPFESGFGLGDGLLKVETIMRYDLQSAQFAYLSACHTTVGDEDSPDESIHLAAAMQFAGFSSVIGTMWAVDDSHTEEITSKFYGHMRDAFGHLDPSLAALALHKTTRGLFYRSSKVPFDQRILYVHIGP